MPARSAIVCLLAALVPFSAAAQSTLSGRVLRQERGDRIPAAGARVVAWSGQKIFASTPVGKDGSYRLNRIPEGAAEFRVALDRFDVAEVNGGESIALRRECPASGSCGEADFLLAEGGVVEVFLTDIRGDPVSGADVLLTERTADEPDSWSVALGRNAGRDQTDDLGRARIWGLAPGRYKVWLRPMYDHGFHLPEQPTTEVPVRAGQQTDVNTTVYAAQPHSITAGLRRPALGAVAGRIVRSGGRPIAGAGILVDGEIVAWSALDGTFRFAAPKSFDGAGLHDPLDRRRWSTRLREVSVVSGQTASASLEALPAE